MVSLPVRLLAVTAVPAELHAVAGPGRPLRIGRYDAVRCDPAAGPLTVLAGGVGPAAAAAATATALALDPAYDVVLSLGIAGGFGGAPVGSVAVASEVVAADLGTGSPAGFLDLASLGFGGVRWPCPLAPVAAARIAAAGLPVVTGPVLTLSTMTGTAARAAELAAAHAPVAEAMEGAGVATAAAAHGRPVLEVRTISNPVGDRARAGWDLPAALAALTAACAALLAEPL